MSSLKEDIAKRQVFYRTPCFQRTKQEILAQKEDDDTLSDVLSFLHSRAFVQYCQLAQYQSQAMENVSFVSRSQYLLGPQDKNNNANADDDDPLKLQFLQALRNPSVRQEQEIIVCFHGTRADPNGIRDILQNGLNPLLRRRQARGPGEYFMKCPVASLHYSRGTGRMLVFAVLLPPAQTGSGMVIVQEPAHQMPLGMIQYAHQHVAADVLPTLQATSMCLGKEYLDVTQCYARNEAFGFEWSNLLLDDNAIGLKSNVDDQLVLQLAFWVPVRIHCLSLTKLRGSNGDEYPTKIHFYVNRPNLSFEDAQDVLPQYTLEDLDAKYLEEGNGEGLPIPMQVLSLKFNKVSTLTIYIEESAGGVVSSIGGFQVGGCPTSDPNGTARKRRK